MSDLLLQNLRTSRKQRAIIALLQYPTTEKAAEAVRRHPTTLRRWLREPEFREALLQARREEHSQSMGRLQHAAQPAVTMLLRIMADTNTPASVRVRAIGTILSQAAKALELEDIEGRVSSLEQVARTKSIK
jgi:hypothetical protein